MAQSKLKFHVLVVFEQRLFCILILSRLYFLTIVYEICQETRILRGYHSVPIKKEGERRKGEAREGEREMARAREIANIGRQDAVIEMHAVSYNVSRQELEEIQKVFLSSHSASGVLLTPIELQIAD